MFKWVVLIFTLKYVVFVTSSKPNIVIMMADDMGWNDVSFHGSNQIPTPNIDALGMGGVILNRHYVAPMCTPSRASLLTGKHPISIGMQHYVIVPDEPWGLGLDQKLMPEYFKEAGYKTHLIGKWHLGLFKKDYAPTSRGFDSFLGYLGPSIDYWDHTMLMLSRLSRGLDMRKNLDTDFESSGNYATDYFTNAAVDIIGSHNKTNPLFLLINHLAPHAGNEDIPLQAPLDEVRKFNYIQNANRRIYAAMVSKLDESVGKVFNALKTKGMLDNTIILFYSDNGAPTKDLHANYGSNAPFKGQKDSPWEGAVRSASVIWSPLIKSKGRVSNQYMHVSDWLPTLAHSAGINVSKHSDIDGVDQWEALSDPSLNPRTKVLINIDDISGYSSYIENEWKFVNGSTAKGRYDDWLGGIDDQILVFDDEYVQKVQESAVGQYLQLDNSKINELRENATVSCSQIKSGGCRPLESPCLFDILNDPCEYNNLAKFQTTTLKIYENKVEDYRKTAIPPRNVPRDHRADPGYYGDIWTYWHDEQNTPQVITRPTRSQSKSNYEKIEINSFACKKACDYKWKNLPNF